MVTMEQPLRKALVEQAYVVAPRHAVKGFRCLLDRKCLQAACLIMASEMVGVSWTPALQRILNRAVAAHTVSVAPRLLFHALDIVSIVDVAHPRALPVDSVSQRTRRLRAIDNDIIGILSAAAATGALLGSGTQPQPLPPLLDLGREPHAGAIATLQAPTPIPMTARNEGDGGSGRDTLVRASMQGMSSSELQGLVIELSRKLATKSQLEHRTRSKLVRTRASLVKKEGQIAKLEDQHLLHIVPGRKPEDECVRRKLTVHGMYTNTNYS